MSTLEAGRLSQNMNSETTISEERMTTRWSMVWGVIMGVEIKVAYLFYTGVDAYRRGARPVGNTEPLQLNASTYRSFLR